MDNDIRAVYVYLLSRNYGEFHNRIKIVSPPYVQPGGVIWVDKYITKYKTKVDMNPDVKTIYQTILNKYSTVKDGVGYLVAGLDYYGDYYNFDSQLDIKLYHKRAKQKING